jgi:ribosome maturation factor RimP
LFVAASVPNSLDGILEPTLAGLGFELVDTQVSGRGRLVRVFMDKPGGITVDDCAAVSRHLSRLFEVEGIDYERLEVSSPGMDRPLRRPADFARFVGHRVDVRMRLADATGRRRYVGVLRGIDGATATVDVDGAPVALQLEGMDRARLVPEL